MCALNTFLFFWGVKPGMFSVRVAIPLLIQAVLLSFVGRIVSTNNRLVFHGMYIHVNPPPAKSLVLLCSSSHPVVLRADNTTHLLCIMFGHDQVWGIYLHEILLRCRTGSARRAAVVQLLVLTSPVKSEGSITTHQCQCSVFQRQREKK